MTRAKVTEIDVYLLPLAGFSCSLCERQAERFRSLIVLGPRDLLLVCETCYELEEVRGEISSLDGSCLSDFDRGFLRKRLREARLVGWTRRHFPQLGGGVS